jgi:dTDP-4-dehydrorhamnose reductase
VKRIYVLGPRGMLGEMVRRHFGAREGFEVVPVDRRFDYDNLVDHFRCYDDEPPAVFVNGIGAIPQKVSRAQDFVLPNILLPLELARTLASQHRLVHPSTDCVFRGDRGTPYPSAAPTDAADSYGWSKLQAERALLARPNTVIVRTSIIGPSSGPASGLLQWFLSQPLGERLSGFTNHYWNGMTTLQWCVEVERLLTRPEVSGGRMVQYGWRGGCSKHEMLQQFRDAFRPDITVTPVEHAQTVDRRLEPEVEVPELRVQLTALRARMEAA